MTSTRRICLLLIANLASMGCVAQMDPESELSAAAIQEGNLDFVLPRSAWDAADEADGCRNSIAARPTHIAIHHTAGPTQVSGSYAAAIRNAQAFHQLELGKADIAYHYIVTADGSVWEGRDWDCAAHHLEGDADRTAFGIALVGCFEPGEPCEGFETEVTPEMIAATGRIVGALARRYGIAIDEHSVMGHHDFPDNATFCPGLQIDGVMNEIRSLGRPAPEPMRRRESPWTMR